MANNLKIFNTPVEVGVRSLVMLFELKGLDVDLQKLVYLDYFLIHSGDVENGPQSLHPATPFRSGEIAVKREVLKKSLQMLHKKSLVDVELTDEGILYKLSESGDGFLSNLNTGYSQDLKDRATWVKSRFGDMSNEEINDFISNNIKHWKAEFISKSQ